MKFRLKHITSLSLCALIGILNQNCGEQSAFSIEELAANHSPSMLDVDLPESQARIGDRIYTASVFADVFLPNGDEISVEQAESAAGEESHHIADYITSEFEASKDKPIFKIINDFVLSKVTEFHGVCSVVDGDSACSSTNTEVRRTSAEVDSIAPASVTRDGYRLSVCNKVLGNDRAVENMIKNITGDETTSMQASHTMDVYHIFYPERDISEEAYNALMTVYQSLSAESDLDKWRAVAVPVCQSSGWQIQ